MNLASRRVGKNLVNQRERCVGFAVVKDIMIVRVGVIIVGIMIAVVGLAVARNRDPSSTSMVLCVMLWPFLTSSRGSGSADSGLLLRK